MSLVVDAIAPRELSRATVPSSEEHVATAIGDDDADCDGAELTSCALCRLRSELHRMANGWDELHLCWLRSELHRMANGWDELHLCWLEQRLCPVEDLGSIVNRRADGDATSRDNASGKLDEVTTNGSGSEAKESHDCVSAV